MAAVIIVARNPASNAFNAKPETRDFFSGTKVPIPPIKIVPVGVYYFNLKEEG